jgi:hypothetical protein
MSKSTSGLIFGSIAVLFVIAGGTYYYKQQNNQLNSLPPGIINEETFGGRSKRHKYSKNKVTKRRK